MMIHMVSVFRALMCHGQDASTRRDAGGVSPLRLCASRLDGNRVGARDRRGHTPRLLRVTRCMDWRCSLLTPACVTGAVTAWFVPVLGDTQRRSLPLCLRPRVILRQAHEDHRPPAPPAAP